MSYGTAAYAVFPFGGTLTNNLHTFFPFQLRTGGEYEAQLELSTDESFYSVFIRQASEGLTGDPFMETRIFTHNNEGEIPQLQFTQGDAIYAQAVVPTARFITVRVTVFDGQLFSIVGRLGD
jgi:hypothetical protein